MSLLIDRRRGKTIILLASPIMIAMLTQTLINVVDTIFIGKLDPSLSIPGQAALGLSLPILWFIGGSLSALAVGTQAMTARRYGADQPAQAGTILFNSLIITFVLSIAFTFAGWNLIPTAFKLLTNNQSVIDLGTPYTQARVLGVFSMVATACYKGFFDGIASTRVHMVACLIMNTVNILLNFVFIYGFGPIPAYDVTGAGIAALISTYIGLAVMIFWSFRHKYLKEFRYFSLQNMKPAVMWSIFKLSVPAMLTQIFIMTGVLLFLKVIDILDENVANNIMRNTRYYGTELALNFNALHAALITKPQLTGRVLTDDWAYVILHSRQPLFMTSAKLIVDILSIVIVSSIAFGQATATLVSQAMGKKDFDLAENYGWDSVKIGMFGFGTIAILIIAFPHTFLNILNSDPLVIQTATPGLRLMASSFMFVAIALILVQALFGAGATRFVMLVELILHALCLAPLAFLLAIYFNLGYIGVWISAMVYLIALACIMAWKFWSGTWKSIEV